MKSTWLYYSKIIWCCSVVSDSLRPNGLQHGQASLSFTISWSLLKLMSIESVMHPAISSSVIPFSSCLQSFPESGSFLMSQLLSGGQNIGASASESVLQMNIHDWFSWELTGLISLQSMGLSRVFSNNTAQKHQFFGAQPSLWSKSHIHTWLMGKSIALTRQSFVGQVMSLLLNTLSRLVKAFLPMSNCLLISWLQLPSAVIFGAQENKIFLF